MRRKSWRCFHCDEVFRSRKQARLHFGIGQVSRPACQIDIAHVRSLEQQLASYRVEDGKVLQEMRRMQSEHQSALMRAEESGYAKGLRDGRQL